MSDTKRLLPDYQSPPLNEVVCGVIVAPVANLLLPHIGLFWGGVIDQYPNCEHAPPMTKPGTGDFLWVDSSTNLPMPRIWFLNAQKTELIQIQNDRFYSNWRQIDAAKDEYPHFDYVTNRFFDTYKKWEAFVQATMLTTLSPIECEVSYINIIPRERGWTSSASLGELFPDFAWRLGRPRFLAPPERLTWQMSFPLPDAKGTLTVRMTPAARTTDKAEVIRLEFQARVPCTQNEPAAMRACFELAHEWIVNSFADLTSMKVQRDVWRRIDTPSGSTQH